MFGLISHYELVMERTMKKFRAVSALLLLSSIITPQAAYATPKATTTSLTTSASPVTIGTQITLTVTVTSAGSPSGSVNFAVSGSQIGSCTLSSATCSITYTWNARGEYPVIATYVPSGNFAASTSAPLTQVVTRYASSVVVASSKPDAYIGNPLNFTITATGPGPTPTGTANLFAYESNTVIGTCTLAAGSCVIALAASTVGNHRVWASYSGDDVTYLPSNSPYIYQHNMAKLTPTVAISHSPSTTEFGAAVTFTATVSGSGGTPVGNVLFEDGEVSIGSCQLTSGTCSITVSNLALESHVIAAEFGGDDTYLGGESSVTHVVTAVALATTIAITSSSNPSIEGRNVTFTVIVSASSGTPDGTVTVKNGETVLGSCTLLSGSCTYTTALLPLGSATLTALYGGSASYLASSGTFSQTVNASAARSTVTSITPSSESTTVGSTVSLAISVTNSSTVTGTVEIKDGGTSIGTCALISGECSISYSPSTVATHSLNATYLGGASFDSSTATINFFVGKQISTLSLTSSGSPAARLTLVTFTATLQASATGFVVFEDGETQIAGCTLSAGRCSVTVSFATTGSHLISAEYGGDALSTSVTKKITQVVGLSVVTAELSSDKAPDAYYETINFTTTLSDATASGTIEVFDGETGIKSCTLVSGTCTLFFYRLTVGSHNMTSVYSGDSTHVGTTSPIYVQVVTLAPTTTALQSSENPYAYGAGMVLTATVTNGGTGPTGVVQFEDYTGAEVILGACTLSGSTCSITLATPLPVGSRKLRAEYTSDGNYAGSVSSELTQVITDSGVIILPETKTSVTAAISIIPVSVMYLEPFTVTSSLTSSGGTPTGTVIVEEEIGSGSDLILGSCVLTSGTCSYTNSTLSVGTHEIYIEYGGTSTFASTYSSKVVITVTPRPVQSISAQKIEAPSAPKIELKISAPIVATINATKETTISFELLDSAGRKSDVSVIVPAGTISGAGTLSVAAEKDAKASEKGFEALEIQILSTGTSPITQLMKPILISVSRQATLGTPSYSKDGVTWVALQKVVGTQLVQGQMGGFYVGASKSLNVLTMQLSVFDILKKQYNLYVKSEVASLSVGTSTSLSFRGGSGTGEVSYSSSTPLICSVSAFGLVKAIAVGSCSVLVAKGHDESHMNAISSPKVIVIRP